LESISIPDSVEFIDWATFMGCSKLKEVTLPDGVILQCGVFENCTGLRNMTIPDNVSLTSWGAAYGFLYKCDGLTVTYKGNEYNHTNFEDLYKAMPQKEYTFNE
ncbi:MAG: leucine-rich repeat domain-containing protein, partial [Oscillospiraceae bacterium]|nr:leucine-rich repeat domain-containing protein [Oscillospiraceae bacterium]